MAISNEIRLKVADAYAEGMPYKEIMEIYKVSESFILKIAKSHGLRRSIYLDIDTKLQILNKLEQGFSHRKIADELKISKKTVGYYFEKKKNKV